MQYSKRISLSLCLALLVIAAGCKAKTANDTVGTTGTATVKVTDVALGRSVGTDKAIADRTDNFKPNDTIYASVETNGTAPNATLRAKWTFQDGQVVDESTRAIAPNARERTEFHISKPDGWPAGKYKVEVFLNDQPADSKTFEVGAR